MDAGEKRAGGAVRRALGVYLVARVLVSIWAAVAVGAPRVEVPDCMSEIYEHEPLVYPHNSPLLGYLVGVWFRWDTGWYTRIAVEGYRGDDGRTAFAPLYPLLIRLTGRLLGGEYLLASLVVSNVALVAMLAVLHRLVELDFSKEMARRTIVYMMACPAGFFLLAGYTESLFLFFAVLSLYAARRGHWWTGGLAAFLASLTRQQGWVLALPLAYEALRRAEWRPWDARRGLLAACSAPAGTLAYTIYLALAGLPGFFDAQAGHWYVQFVAPWTSIAVAVQSALSGEWYFQDMINTATFFLSLVLILSGLRRLKPIYWLYTIPSQLIFLSALWPGESLHSMPRYFLMLFPNMITLALITRRRWLFSAVLFVFILIQLVEIAMFTRWGWVA
jgi:Predicted integral membrane protein